MNSLLHLSRKIAALSLLLALLPLQLVWAGITNTGTDYTIDCSNEAPSTVLSQTLTTTTSFTVTMATCANYVTRGHGVSPRGGGVATPGMVFTVPAGFIGSVEGYQANTAPFGVDITLNFVAPPNVAPAFIGATNSLVVTQNASATDIKHLLHVSDSDVGQTLTWSLFGPPSHGTLSFSNATAASGGADITPGGSITYTPTAGYVGGDSFFVRVTDGSGGAIRGISVTVSAPTVANVPTLSEWGLIILSSLMAVFGIARVHRRRMGQ